MFEQFFNDLQMQVKQHLGDAVSLIDEDCGQLQALQEGKDQYPVTFPCVLISPAEVQWDNLKMNLQHGRATVIVRLAIDCYDDTHLGSGQESAAAARMALADKLNAGLHGWRFDGCNTVLIRRTSRQYSLPGGIKVYETQYSTIVDR